MRGVLRQLLVGGMTLALAALLWARFVPVSHPILDRIGLLGPLQRAGIVREAVAAPRGAPGGPRGGVTVVAAPPATTQVAERVTAIGTARARQSVAVEPEVSGRIVHVAIAPGARISVGAVLAELDREAEEIARAQAELTLSDARDRYDRATRLQAAGSATELQIREAELVLRQAELRLRQAEYDLDRRTILAPIAGWVGILDVDVGQPVSANTEIARIDDREVLLVDFRIPERFVGRVAAGDQVEARALARSETSTGGVIQALDNRVDAASRTLRLQAVIQNEADEFRAGMAFEISFDVPGAVLPAVPPLAIQWGTQGAFVWVLREGKAARQPVQIVQRNAEEVLVRAAFQPGDLVVSEGVQALRPGAEVANVLSTAQTALPGPRI